MILLGWVLDKPLALLFDPFESIVLYISGMLVRLVYSSSSDVLRSRHDELRRRGRQVQLARRHDPHVPVCYARGGVLVLSWCVTCLDLGAGDLVLTLISIVGVNISQLLAQC